MQTHEELAREAEKFEVLAREATDEFISAIYRRMAEASHTSAMMAALAEGLPLTSGHAPPSALDDSPPC
jgi:hypothetical protein